MRRSILFFLAIVMTVAVQANPIVWTGDGDGTSWSDGDNWDTDVIPDVSSIITITDATVIILSSTSAVAESMICSGTITIEAGGKLTMSGSPIGVYAIEWVNTPGNLLTINGSLVMNNGGGMLAQGAGIIVAAGGNIICNDIHGFAIFQTPSIPVVFTNDGTIIITDNDFVTSIFADFTNNGTITMTRAGRIISNLENNGSIDMFKCGLGISVKGVCSNSGTIAIDSSVYGLYFSDDNAEFVNTGMLDVSGYSTNAITFFADDCKLINQSSGTIKMFDSEEIAIQGFITNDFEIINSGIIDIRNIENIAIHFDRISLINEETGDIFIEDVEYGFWKNFGLTDFLNEGFISIKDIDDSGFYQINVVNTATGTIELENVGVVGIDGNVINSGTVTLINGCNSAGIEGDLDNSGIISMTNIGGNGIRFGDVLNTGHIIMNSFGITGIDVNDTLVNSGTLSLTNGPLGIRSFGSILSEDFVSNNGQITLEGISNTALFISNAEFKQDVLGSINIENSDVAIELRNDATFENSGQITINSTITNAIDMQECNLKNNTGGEITIDSANVGIKGSFTNDTIWNSGIINISNTVLEGIIFSVGKGVLENSSSGTMDFVGIGRDAAIVAEIDNAGSLTVSNGCQWNAIEGDVINSGNILFSLLGGRGIEGAFNNSGSVVFDTLGADGFRVLNGKSFNNSGTIALTSVPNTSIFVSGSGSSWTNSGDITITGGFGNALHLMEAGSSSQTQDGSLVITGKNIGIIVNDCGFTHNGITSISNSASGVSTSTDADFNIEVNSTLMVADCDRGITASTGAIFENSGSVKMTGQLAIHGMFVLAGAQFANFGSGILMIDRAEMTAIRVSNASVINLGVINLTSDLVAIANLGDFENRPTGTVKILESGSIGLSNESNGVFSNQGNLDIFTGAGAVDIQNVSGGSLLNSGMIIARQ